MGQPILIANKNNIFTYAYNAAAKTVSISNVNNFPLDISSLVSVYDVTTASAFNMLQPISFDYAYTNGLPIYVWTFATVPGGSANSDTLDIIIDIPVSQADYSALLQTNGATI